MNTKEAIKSALRINKMVLTTYLSDLSDADFLVRALPNTHHIAWQLGHLISAERHFMEFIKPGASVALPEGFSDKHSKESATNDGPTKFENKSTYLEVFEKQHNTTVQILESLSDSDLDKPGIPSMSQLAPTVGDMFILQAGHYLMHAGQFVAIRRKLNKPVLI